MQPLLTAVLLACLASFLAHAFEEPSIQVRRVSSRLSASPCILSVSLCVLSAVSLLARASVLFLRAHCESLACIDAANELCSILPAHSTQGAWSLPAYTLCATHELPQLGDEGSGGCV